MSGPKVAGHKEGKLPTLLLWRRWQLIKAGCDSTQYGHYYIPTLTPPQLPTATAKLPIPPPSFPASQVQWCCRRLLKCAPPSLGTMAAEWAAAPWWQLRHLLVLSPHLLERQGSKVVCYAHISLPMSFRQLMVLPFVSCSLCTPSNITPLHNTAPAFCVHVCVCVLVYVFFFVLFNQLSFRRPAPCGKFRCMQAWHVAHQVGKLLPLMLLLAAT